MILNAVVLTNKRHESKIERKHRHNVKISSLYPGFFTCLMIKEQALSAIAIICNKVSSSTLCNSKGYLAYLIILVSKESIVSHTFIKSVTYSVNGFFLSEDGNDIYMTK